MKKLLFTVLMIFAILLTACSVSSTSTPMNSSDTDLPLDTQLAVGTLKLTGTDQDITAEQAEDLVVYWQVYEELGQSETAAQAEVDGLIAQIQETLTADQLQAITDMQITQQDVLASMQGITVAASSSDSSAISLPSGGSMPAGGPPADGSGAPMDGGMPADMGGAAPASGTDQSQTASSPASLTTIPSALVEAVIQSLQQKIPA